jgi:type I restriction enzyme S subunit
MSRINELIEELCPAGVVFKELGEVFKISRGRVISKEYLRDNIGEYPVYSSQTANNGQIGKIATYDFDGEYLTWTTDGANAGTIFYRNGKFSITNVCGLLKANSEQICPKFVFYVLRIIMKGYVLSGMGNPKLMSNVVQKIPIPIPPLEVQEEIVKTLDLFTMLEAELEAELETRNTQYTHYRDSLLSFEGKDVEWKTLGELGEFIRGNGLQKKDFTESGVGCIHYGQIYTHYGSSATKTKTFVSPDLAKKLKKARKNDLIIAGVSENVEDVCKAVVWLGDEDICISGDAFIFRHKQNPKYIGYLLQTKSFLEFKKKYAQGAKVTRLQSGRLPQYIVPIPSLKEQERIASILEKFDALVNDISIGLPAEIEGRRKQYEFYRNRLLTFKELSNG